MDQLSSTAMELLKIARHPRERAMSGMVEKKQRETKPDWNKKVGKSGRFERVKDTKQWRFL